MILESVDEVRAQGVTVYPHVLGWAAEMAAKPTTDEHIADAVATVVRLSHGELAAFAKQLVAADAQRADRLIDALITKLEVEPDAQRHERIAAATMAKAGSLE